jgi:RHS repeat-associated protein
MLQIPRVYDSGAKPNVEVTNYAPSNQISYTSNFRNYELTNHLGNVLATIKDEKQQVSLNGTTVDYYEPIVMTANDYYPFGMVMPNRSFSLSSKGYRFGFNGKELENDLYGSGNAYDFENRIADVRLGKYLSLDPLQAKYPMLSPYLMQAANPILFIDKDGKENVIYEVNMDSGTFGANVKLTLEISITKFTEDPSNAAGGGRTQSIMMNAADIK